MPEVTEAQFVEARAASERTPLENASIIVELREQAQDDRRWIAFLEERLRWYWAQLDYDNRLGDEASWPGGGRTREREVVSEKLSALVPEDTPDD